MITFVAVSFSWKHAGYWGRGPTENEAMQQLRKSGWNSKKGSVKVWKVEHDENQDKPFVDDGGAVCWHGEREEVSSYTNGKRTAAPLSK